jgi:hypothetical protein
MGNQNQTLLQKADLALADIASAGALTAEQSTAFVRSVLDAPTILAQARTVVMRSDKQWVDKIGFDSRILRPAVEHTALSESDRSKPTVGRVELDSQEVIAEVRVGYATMEDVIERALAATNGAPNASPGGLHNSIVQMIAARAAADLEELGVQGDTATVGDAYLALVDGWLKKAGHPSAVGGAFSPTAVAAGLKVLPSKYQADLAALKHFVAPQAVVDLRAALASRATGLGDTMMTNGGEVSVLGTGVVGCSRMPSAKGILVNPQNLLFGIHRNISIEFDKSITTRQYIVVVTARVAFNIETADACVAYSGITIA